MSLVHQPLPVREPGQADSVNGPETSYTEASQLSSQSQKTYDDCIIDQLYGLDIDDDQEAADMNATQQKNAALGSLAPPALPEKSNLRASRLFDDLHLKLRASIEAHQILEARDLLETANPHEVYMSSEEEASSSADDFSDYDYDSSNDDPQSPTRRSYEDTAKVVSVVFIGKPSLVDLPSVRRSGSSSTVNSRRESMLCAPTSTLASMTRPSTSSSGSVSSHFSRKSSGSHKFSSLLMAGKPNGHQRQHSFLSIDPYANGSTYSLPTTHEEDDAESDISPSKATALFRGVSKTFTLARKRSKPLLRDFAASQSRDSLSASSSPAKEVPVSVVAEKALQPAVTVIAARPQTPPRSPQSPVTYNEIMRAARKNASTPPRRVSTSTMGLPDSPVSPVTEARRSLLAGLAARRRANKAASRLM